MGGALGFEYQKTKLPYYSYYETSTVEVRSARLSMDFYFGYFVVRRFVMGLLAMVQVDWTKGGSEGSSTSWEGILAVAPGFAVPIGARAFIYGDALLGFMMSKGKSGGYSLEISGGYVGGELGLKFAIGRNCLLRIGFRPAYVIGKAKPERGDVKDLRIGLTLGFSGFL